MQGNIALFGGSKCSPGRIHNLNRGGGGEVSKLTLQFAAKHLEKGFYGQVL